MDEIMIKKKKKHLKLQNYAPGRHVAALKVVHFLNDEDGDFSHSLFHSHNFYELIAVVSGSGIHEINDQSYPLHPGSVFLLSPKDCHRYEYSESLTVLNFMFDSAVLRPFRSFLAHVPGYDHLFATDTGNERMEFIVNSSVLAELDLLLNTIASENRAPMPGMDLIQMANLIRVLVLILRNTAGSSQEEYGRGSIGTAVSFMQRNFQKDITLPALAKLVNLSVSSFYRKFMNEFKTPPMQWLLLLRIRKAGDFLLRSEMTIAEIAAAVGFADPLYFSRQFRKITGFTPRNYRKRHRGPLHLIQGNKTSFEYLDPNF